ncbi:glycosyltransferase [Euzebya rosea]|uniref:glycosyltransferase n=1 Tax=Euzebya rosea TaxID=2052804 RepID=UPI000D3E0AAD|nr:glycosyltransferase family A protein [Euzebya rosea]
MTDAGPLVSVIVPHLNDADGLRACLASLARQVDAPPHEVIVVDNGSVELPEQVCAEVPGTVLLCEAEPGPGRARNHGAAVAAGSILAFIDADCRADQRWLRTIVDRFAAAPEVDVIGGQVTVVPRRPGRPSMVEAHELVFGYRMRLYVERDGYTATLNMAVRRDAFRRVGPFGGRDIAEDRDWGRRATALGLRIAYVDDMRITTAARPDRTALRCKWDRLLSHDAAELGADRRARSWFLLRAVAVAASPPVEVLGILVSDRVEGPRSRWMAVLGTTWIRLYRARRMVSLLVRGNAAELQEGWNGAPGRTLVEARPSSADG